MNLTKVYYFQTIHDQILKQGRGSPLIGTKLLKILPIYWPIRIKCNINEFKMKFSIHNYSSFSASLFYIYSSLPMRWDPEVRIHFAKLFDSKITLLIFINNL